MTTPVLIQVEAKSYHHAVGDKQRPTAYEVHEGDRVLGTVFSLSGELWDKRRRIRTRFRGYSRHWGAVCARGHHGKPHLNTVTRIAHTRSQALNDLLAHWNEYHR